MRYFPDSENVITADEVQDSVRALRERPVPTMQDLLDRVPALVTPAEIREMAAARVKPVDGVLRAVGAFVEEGLWPKKEASE